MQTLLEQLTYIIPVRLVDEARRRNLGAITDWVLTRFAGVRVLIVEVDEAPRMHVEASTGELSHLFLRSATFDKGWAMNCGAKAAARPYLAFGDADIAVSQAQLLRALALLETHDAVKPYHRAQVIDLDEAQSARFAASLDVTGLQGCNRRGLTNFAGGLFLARRDFYLALGGFPEGFCGWGGEDDAMGFLLERFARCAELPGPCVHLAHPLAQTSRASYLANVRRVIDVAMASRADLSAWNRKRRETMGDPTRREPS